MSVKAIKIGLFFLAMLYLSIVIMWRFPSNNNNTHNTHNNHNNNTMGGSAALLVGHNGHMPGEVDHELVSYQRREAFMAASWNTQQQRQSADAFDLLANTFDSEEFNLVKVKEIGM